MTVQAGVNSYKTELSFGDHNPICKFQRACNAIVFDLVNDAPYWASIIFSFNKQRDTSSLVKHLCKVRELIWCGRTVQVQWRRGLLAPSCSRADLYPCQNPQKAVQRTPGKPRSSPQSACHQFSLTWATVAELFTVLNIPMIKVSMLTKQSDD